VAQARARTARILPIDCRPQIARQNILKPFFRRCSIDSRRKVSGSTCMRLFIHEASRYMNIYFEQTAL
jgi:hypothetical protein